ncbi:transporter [Paramicrobacterium agarici]|uniref:ABC-2 type transport system permease protein n=1 Tax=Paramicrobacterium agarici TaxID=630514 RepID=A0A2A9DU84_9MICO|nr:transporter [Microbacterium agarici]PFG30258.1 ABC-2 type transport system permease protein [Microbacterium agarici]TQO23265.1 ABC-2 type transport system permease protein [Microbacterium agarici]
MVAVLVGLRFRSMWNALQRNPWQLVGAILGALYGLGMLGLLFVGFVLLSLAPLELARLAVVGAGSVLLLGWLIGPLVTVGVDQTLDPVKLSPFPVPRNTLFVALTASGVLGIPGIVTAVAALGSAIVWWRHPLAIVAALVCAAVAVLTCVTASRAFMAVSSGVSSGRRFRELTGVLIFIPLILLGPIIVGITEGARSFADVLPTIATVLGWTPFGAAWAVPGDVAAGEWGAAAARFAIALATLAVCVMLWRSGLNRMLSSPLRSTSSAQSRKGLGMLGIVPDSRTGAVMARSLTYWMRDPRYAQQLIVVPLIVALMVFYGMMGDGGSVQPTIGLILAAYFLSTSLYADVSYDGTAFALHLTTGVRGIADRAGRALAVAAFAVPLIVILTVAVVALTGDVASLPATLGVTLGITLAGFAAASVTSALLVFPVPKAGDNPFKSQPGAALPSMLAMLGTFGGATVLALPVIVLGIVTIVTGSTVIGWITLAVGAVVGAAELALGIVVGGRIFDRRGPELLARLRT